MPKSQTFQMVVPGSPEEVARRLKQQTRWRLFPYQASVFGGGTRPLGGRVRRKWFAVSLDERDAMGRMTAVARGTLVQAGPGRTRIEGVAGMPRWVAWDLRLGTALLALAIAAVPLLVLGTAGSAQAVLWGVLIFLASAVIGVGIIGMNVNHADERVRPVVETLERVLLTGAPSPEPTRDSAPTDTKAAHRARQRDRA